MKDSTFEKYKLVVDEWFVNGFNGVEAYLKFYPSAEYKSADASFRKILENTRITEYAQSKRETIQKEHNITLAGQLDKLNRLREMAEQREKFGDAINAVKEENKLAALYEEDNRQKNPLGNIEKTKIKFVRKRGNNNDK